MTLKYIQQQPSPLPPPELRDAPMRSLNLKEMRQVTGGPGGFPQLDPKKP
jgi:hypothetical protein